jgi:hypothetical protein
MPNCGQVSGGDQMQVFLGRFFGWYVWLGCYTAAIGALVGMSFFFPLLPILIVLFVPIYTVALTFAAPLNLLILPVAFHVLREHPKRALWLGVAGCLGGLVSPAIAVLTLMGLGIPFPWPMAHWNQTFWESPVIAAFSVIGAIAGLICARVFNKHGDKASLFDVNGQLAALREQQSVSKGTAGGTP